MEKGNRNSRLVEKKEKRPKNERLREAKRQCETAAIKAQRAIGEDSVQKDAPVAKIFNFEEEINQQLLMEVTRNKKGG